MEMKGARQNYPSLQNISSLLSDSAAFIPLRKCIRYSVNSALSEKYPTVRKKLDSKGCVIHSLICEWLRESGYGLTAIAMEAEMGNDFVENSSKYNIKNVSIGDLLDTLEISKLDQEKMRKKQTEEIQNDLLKKPEEEPKVDRIPIKRSNLPKEFKKEVEERIEAEDKKLEHFNNLRKKPGKTESPTTDSESTETNSSSSSSSTSSSSDSSDSTDSEKSEPPSPSSSSAAPWRPSNLGLMTDTIPENVNSSHLPSIFPSKLPKLGMSPKNETAGKKKKSATSMSDIEKLLGSDPPEDEEKAEEKEEAEEEEEVKREKEEKAEVKNEEEKKKEDEKQPENRVISSEEESIDELDDFDTGLLSSGGSDFSF